MFERMYALYAEVREQNKNNPEILAALDISTEEIENIRYRQAALLSPD